MKTLTGETFRIWLTVVTPNGLYQIVRLGNTNDTNSEPIEFGKTRNIGKVNFCY
jgi:hypothetical protein